MKTLLIDSNSLINRAFYALPLLSTADGIYTNAVYGFLKMLYGAIDEYQPDNIVCAFDVKKPTFRHEAYAEYKAGRKPMPAELVPQVPLLKEVLHSLGIFTFDIAGFEADDVIGTYARLSREAGGEAVIVTGDRDSFQLINERTSVWFTKKGISDLLKLTPENLKENYGVEPHQVCDLKALMGDSSDNIPGVPGVGEKTALSLIEKYSSLDNIIKHSDEITGKLGEKIRNGISDAEKSRYLVTITDNVPVKPLSEAKYVAPDDSVLAEIFNKYQFKSLLSRVNAQEQLHGFTAKDFSEFTFSGDKIAILIEKDKVSVAIDDSVDFVAPISYDLLSLGVTEEQIKDVLLPIIRDNSVKKYFYDCKYAMHFFNEEIKNVADDVMLAEYLCNASDDDFSFEKICKKHSCEKGASSIFYVAKRLNKALENKCMTDLYRNVELPLAEVLFSMEQEGFFVDESILRSLGAEFSKKISDLSAEIFALAEEEFNINSPKQLSEILFNKMGLPATKKTKTGFSTDNEALEAIDHPIAERIIEYRQVQKLKSTYIDGMFPLMNQKTGRIHSTFNQAVTSTGRISSTEPNLQNIPVRSELGKSIRKAFMAEKEDYVLVNADYSQIELRVLAHLSGDKTLSDSFKNNEDIHARTAAEVFGIELNEVSSQMRSRAKAVNFGIVYGISDFGLAKNINSSRKEAGEFIQKYFEKYPKIKEYMACCVQEAKHQGYASTILNRRREIPQIRAQNFNMRSFGERVAMNTPIQGSAADIIKLAMLKVYDFLKNSSYRAKLILQVHDELILEVHRDDAEAVEKNLKEIMENVISLDVPLIAEANTGKTWFDLK